MTSSSDYIGKERVLNAEMQSKNGNWFVLSNCNGHVENLSVKAVMGALNLIKTGKAAKPSGITFKLLKTCQDESVKKLAEVADDLLQGKEMPKSKEKEQLDTNL